MLFLVYYTTTAYIFIISIVGLGFGDFSTPFSGNKISAFKQMLLPQTEFSFAEKRQLKRARNSYQETERLGQKMPQTVVWEMNNNAEPQE